MRRLATDRGLRLRVETARRLGISLRRLDGWTPQRETLHEHDEAGRIVRSVGWVESEWDETQRGWMLALAEWEAARCRQCGGDLAETTDPTNDADNPHGTGVYRPAAGTPIRCHRCTALARSEHAYRENDHPHALIHHVELTPRR